MFRRLLVLLITLAAVSSTAGAQPLADKVHADALIYLGWSGTSSMGPGYEKSVVGQFQISRFPRSVGP